FRVHTLDGFGFEDGDDALVAAAGALVAYLAEVQPQASEHLRPPRIERPGVGMALDEMTRRNLELVEPLRPDLAGRIGGRAGTLIEVVDETLTAMGGRLLRRWILRPLVVAEEIWRRQDAVAELVDAPSVRRRLREELKGIRDLERLAAKVGACRITPRELRALGDPLDRRPGPAGGRARPDRPRPLRRPAGDAGRGWRDPGGLQRGARRAARHPRRRAGDDRPAPDAGARADGDPVAQGRLQPRLRLLHRG